MLPDPTVCTRLSLPPSPFFPSAYSASNSPVCSTLTSPFASACVFNSTPPFKFNSFGWFTFGHSFIAPCSARKSSTSFPVRREPRTFPVPSILVSHPSGANCAVIVSALRFVEPSAPCDSNSGFFLSGPGATVSFSARNALSRVSVSFPACKCAARASASTGPDNCIVRDSRSKSRLLPVTRIGSFSVPFAVFFPVADFSGAIREN